MITVYLKQPPDGTLMIKFTCLKYALILFIPVLLLGNPYPNIIQILKMQKSVNEVQIHCVCYDTNKSCIHSFKRQEKDVEMK